MFQLSDGARMQQPIWTVVALTAAVCQVPEEAPQEVVVGLLVELQRAGVLQERQKLAGEALAQLLRRTPDRHALSDRQETGRKKTAREAVRSTETRQMENVNVSAEAGHRRPVLT
jgi:hypothetical protein